MISPDLYPTPTTTTTTHRPRPQFPGFSNRPILDGLTWLWRTWQDTAPNHGTSTSTRTRTRASSSQSSNIAQQSTTHNGDTRYLNFDDGLDSDTAAVTFI